MDIMENGCSIICFYVNLICIIYGDYEVVVGVVVVVILFVGLQGDQYVVVFIVVYV